jgi:lipid A 3-O-deacylase
MTMFLLAGPRRPSTVPWILIPVLFLALPGFLGAQAAMDGGAGAPPRFSLGLGFFGVGHGDHPALSLEGAYRFPVRLPWALEAQAGALGTTEGSLYGYGELLRSVDLPSGLVLSLSLGAGLYRRGGGIDLGSSLEFKSGVALGWEVGSRGRISLFGYHLSNGGLGDRNPGVEVVGVGYTLGFR